MLTYTVVALNIFYVNVDIHSGRFKYIFVYILPEDGHRSEPKHVVGSAQ
jgi:hypothetical protein